MEVAALQLVWPFSSGEVIVQSYNAVLTLSHVHAVRLLTTSVSLQGLSVAHLHAGK